MLLRKRMLVIQWANRLSMNKQFYCHCLAIEVSCWIDLLAGIVASVSTTIIILIKLVFFVYELSWPVAITPICYSEYALACYWVRMTTPNTKRRCKK